MNINTLAYIYNRTHRQTIKGAIGYFVTLEGGGALRLCGLMVLGCGGSVVVMTGSQRRFSVGEGPSCGGSGAGSRA